MIRGDELVWLIGQDGKGDAATQVAASINGLLSLRLKL
jgi:hypothetical protein